MRSTSGISESACHTMYGFLPVTCSSATAASRSQLDAGKTTIADFMRSLVRLSFGRAGWLLLHRLPHAAGHVQRHLEPRLPHDLHADLRRLLGQLAPKRASVKAAKSLQFRKREMPRHDMRLQVQSPDGLR